MHGGTEQDVCPVASELRAHMGNVGYLLVGIDEDGISAINANAVFSIQSAHTNTA
jgi:hypothetical protein